MNERLRWFLSLRQLSEVRADMTVGELGEWQTPAQCVSAHARASVKHIGLGSATPFLRAAQSGDVTLWLKLLAGPWSRSRKISLRRNKCHRSR